VSRRAAKLPTLALTVLLAVGLLPIPPAPAAQVETVETPLISATDLIDRVARGEALTILDVRTVEEYADGHVPGAVNIPHTEIADRLAEIAALGDNEIVLYCRSGRRAGVAAEVLRAAGYGRLLHLDGDMNGWREDQLPIVRESGS